MPTEVSGLEVSASSAYGGPASAILVSPEAGVWKPVFPGSGCPHSQVLCPSLDTSSRILGLEISHSVQGRKPWGGRAGGLEGRVPHGYPALRVQWA